MYHDMAHYIRCQALIIRSKYHVLHMHGPYHVRVNKRVRVRRVAFSSQPPPWQRQLQVSRPFPHPTASSPFLRDKNKGCDKGCKHKDPCKRLACEPFPHHAPLIRNIVDKPKREPTAYQIFCKEHMKKWNEANPGRAKEAMTQVCTHSPLPAHAYIRLPRIYTLYFRYHLRCSAD